MEKWALFALYSDLLPFNGTKPMKFAVILFFSLSFCIHYSLAVDDTLKLNQTLRDTGQTLVSSGKKFKLGFFNLQNSENRYVGIWFNNIEELTAVWVANRDNPLTDTSGIFKITETGNIVILSNKTENPIWSSNSSAKDPILQLLNTGNLVVKDGDSGNYAWQSFDDPCDSLIAGMKLGWDFKTGQNWKLNSWNNLQDPSTGIYTYEQDRNGIPQYLLRRRQDILYRNGPWDGVRSGGDATPTREQSFFIPKYVVNETHNYYTFDNADNSTLIRFYLNTLGSPVQQRWDPTTAIWVLTFATQKEDCDTFARCGPNGICVESDSSVCHCPTGFVPKAPEAWAAGNSSSGCILKTSFNCGANEGFKKFSKLKLPYNSEFTVNGTVVEKEECELICRRNCSCVAYAVAKVGGCVVWSGELFDMRRFSVGGQDVYIRMDASELKSDENEKKRAVVIAVSVVSGFGLLFLVGGYIIRKRRRTSRSHISQFDNAATNSNEHEHPILLEEDVDQLPSFGLDIIANATDNFSATNKIGEGGFGPVYKGMLPTGETIAVKRLSRDSGQGLPEFKNEVVLIAKLQHWNLVRLLGCCIQGEERMLIYEYMPNKSLDLYIFNRTRGNALDWPKRFDIIVGIARGLLYLHRDSRLRIIHRDLKASNILLDDEMNPKISDFGMARIFGGDQNEVNTKRVVGTYGYMSPEFAIDGHFSVKSDVFSFGVMVLEIVSGKKNRGFEHPDHELNLLGHAWKLWNDGRPMELMDILMENVPVSEVLRCIQVGLLCVQKRPEDRPLMASVLFMLDSENASLPQPKQPGFYTERTFTETDSSSSLNKQNISTEISITILKGR